MANQLVKKGGSSDKDSSQKFGRRMFNFNFCSGIYHLIVSLDIDEDGGNEI